MGCTRRAHTDGFIDRVDSPTGSDLSGRLVAVLLGIHRPRVEPMSGAGRNPTAPATPRGSDRRFHPGGFTGGGGACCTVGVHVVVVGCGRVGSGLACTLSQEGHKVAVIDRSARAFRRLPEDWDGRRIVGSGFDRDDLERAGAIGADALAAVTSGDNTNILTVRIARETYHIPRVVARIYDPRRAEIYQRLGIPTVATVTWTIDQVRRRLLPETIAGEWADASGRLVLIDRAMPEQWAGRRLAEIEDPGRVRLVGVTRAGVPRLDACELVGQEGDQLHVAVMKDAMAEFEQRVGIPSEPGELVTTGEQPGAADGAAP
ncbi:MAG: potassium channel family protein [Acidimicrobiales bacterium]